MKTIKYKNYKSLQEILDKSKNKDLKDNIKNLKLTDKEIYCYKKGNNVFGYYDEEIENQNGFIRTIISRGQAESPINLIERTQIYKYNNGCIYKKYHDDSNGYWNKTIYKYHLPDNLHRDVIKLIRYKDSEGYKEIEKRDEFGKQIYWGNNKNKHVIQTYDNNAPLSYDFQTSRQETCGFGWVREFDFTKIKYYPKFNQKRVPYIMKWNNGEIEKGEIITHKNTLLLSEK